MKVKMYIGKEAIAIGNEEIGEVIADIPLSELSDDERAALADVGLSTVRGQLVVNLEMGQVTKPMQMDISAVIAELAARRAEKDAEVARLLALPLEKRINCWGTGVIGHDNDPRLVEWKREAEAYIKAKAKEKLDAEVARLLVLPVEKRCRSHHEGLVCHPNDPRLAVWKSEAEAHLRELKAKMEQACKDRDAREEREKADREMERDVWIGVYGSDRLKAILAEGYIEQSRAVYRDERIAHDLPGWELGGDGEDKEIRNPTLTAIEALQEERKANSARPIEVEDLDLVYVVWKDKDEYGDTCKTHGWPCLTGEYLGWQVRLPVEPGE